MRKAIFLLVFSALLGGCTSLNDQVQQHTSLKDVGRPNVTPYAVGLILATPPVNTWIFGPCKEEFMMPEGRREQCDFHYKLRGETAPYVRTQASGQSMAYQPGELQCYRTLGFKTECAIVSGAPRPNYLNAAPPMGAN